jgi:hypothetical protein
MRYYQYLILKKTHGANSNEIDSLWEVERQEERDSIVVTGVTIQPEILGCGCRSRCRHDR